MAIPLLINGRTYDIDVDPQTALLTVLREHLDLTGSKYGCREGLCGACTVLVDGKYQRSCVTKIGTLRGKRVTTIEGLASGDRLHPVQQAFLDESAMQCAFCTPGMIMSAVSLLSANRQPSDEQIIDHMEGNVCRCGTYSRILAAVHRAAAQMPADLKGTPR